MHFPFRCGIHCPSERTYIMELTRGKQVSMLALFYPDFAEFPTLQQFWYVNGHMFTVVAIARTFGRTRDQSLLSGCCGSAQCAPPIDSRMFACRPFGYSKRHIDVGREADEATTRDRDGERRLDRFRHTSLDAEARNPAFTSRFRIPASD